MIETMYWPDSTSVKTAVYDYSNGELKIRFKNGKWYRYDVPSEVWKELQCAKSAGSFIQNEIVSVYKGHKIDDEF